MNKTDLRLTLVRERSGVWWGGARYDDLKSAVAAITGVAEKLYGAELGTITFRLQ